MVVQIVHILGVFLMLIFTILVLEFHVIVHLLSQDDLLLEVA